MFVTVNIRERWKSYHWRGNFNFVGLPQARQWNQSHYLIATPRTRSHCLSPNVSMFLSKAIEGNPFIPSINSPRSPTQHSYRKEYNTVDVYQSKNLTGEMPTETTTSLTPTSHIITKVKTMKMSQALLKTERISVSCVSTIPCCKCCVQYRWT